MFACISDQESRSLLLCIISVTIISHPSSPSSLLPPPPTTLDCFGMRDVTEAHVMWGDFNANSSHFSGEEIFLVASLSLKMLQFV